MSFGDTGEILQQYALIPPHAYALVMIDPETKQTTYKVMETPPTTKENEVYQHLRREVIEDLDTTMESFYDEVKKRFQVRDLERQKRKTAAERAPPGTAVVAEEELQGQKDTLMRKEQEEIARAYLREKLEKIIKRDKLKVSKGTLDKIFYYISRDLVGFGIIEPFLQDPAIEDISCDGVNIPIYIWHREYESIRTNVRFVDETDLNHFAIKVAQRAGRHISVANPLLDASLPDGSRINVTFSREITMRGSTFTIRKFKEDPLTIVDLITWGTINEEIAAFFWFVLEHNKSLLIAGGTASGKTTLLNSLAMFIRPGNKIVSIEDTAELQIPHDNWIQSVARPGFGGMNADGTRRGEVSMFDLLRAALRQRPDFLFVGEVRGEEAYSLFQAMATGHAGMGTIHGDNAQGVIRRLETEPMNIARTMLQSLDMICVQRAVRRKGGKKLRRTIEVVEIVEVDPVTDDLVTNRVFSWNATDDTFFNFGRSYILDKISDEVGMSDVEIQEELKKRREVLNFMVRTKKRAYREVAQTVFEYFNDPDGTHKRSMPDVSIY